MIFKLNTIFFVIIFTFIVLLISCEEKKETAAPDKPDIVSIKITQPEANKKPESKKPKQDKKISNSSIKLVKPALPDKSEQEPEKEIPAHYSASGKIDPFIALIQATPEKPKGESPKKTDRILTPLEKIELSQIRLVAVIITRNKRIAMVEEASGKGYEVNVGTYIGRKQGKITEIKNSSIVVKEPVRDYMGKLSERIQEIKIHKDDIEE